MQLKKAYRYRYFRQTLRGIGGENQACANGSNESQLRPWKTNPLRPEGRPRTQWEGWGRGRGGRTAGKGNHVDGRHPDVGGKDYPKSDHGRTEGKGHGVAPASFSGAVLENLGKAVKQEGEPRKEIPANS